MSKYQKNYKKKIISPKKENEINDDDEIILVVDGTKENSISQQVQDNLINKEEKMDKSSDLNTLNTLNESNNDNKQMNLFTEEKFNFYFNPTKIKSKGLDIQLIDGVDIINTRSLIQSVNKFNKFI
jgi:hypothetical protein